MISQITLKRIYPQQIQLPAMRQASLSDKNDMTDNAASGDGEPDQL